MREEKKLAAEEAVKLVKNEMVVGLGTGSTAAYMIKALGEMISNGLSMVGVPSSEKTAELARKVGIPLTTLEEVRSLDINIDGADEFDSELQLIKGGGGALLREKIIAHNSKINVIIADSTKYVAQLGKFKLPVEIIPFAKNSVLEELQQMALEPVLRTHSGVEFRTDENNVIVDVNIQAFTDLHNLNNTLLNIPGIVETGLFLNLADIVIMGKESETVVFKNPSPRRRFS